MNDLELHWLIPALMEVTGLALALGVFGFAYEVALRDRVAFITSLEKGANTRWLAAGGVLFALGLLFTQAGWASKGMAIAIAVGLMGLAWANSLKKEGYQSKVARQKVTKKSVLKLGIKISLGLFLVLILAWVINLGWHAYHLYGVARNLEANQNQLRIKAIIPMINEAASDIGVIHTELRPLFPIFSLLDGIPGAGPYLNQIEPLLTYSDGLAQAGKEILTGLEPFLAESASGESGLTLPERTSQVLELEQGHYATAAQSIEQAAGVRSRIHPELLPDTVRSLFTKLDERFDLLVAGVKLLQVAPALLGNGEAQNYLVLAQNRDELRATGGFISGIGLITIQDGKILQFTLGDSYAIDDFTKPYPTPPEALKRFMLADYWMPRDANWSPDFPTTAKEAQALYTLSTGVETQGVIAFNQLAVQRVLEVIGPVQVPGTDEPVSVANVETYMRQAWAPEPEQGISQEWWLHRKDFMQLLGNVILDEVLKAGDQTQLLNLGKAVVDMIEQGQLLVYFNDTSAQAALEKGEIDGGLHSGKGDYLYLVDSNVGFNKADSIVKRSVKYEMDLQNLDHPVGKVTLSYSNEGTGNVPCQQIASYGNGTYQDNQLRCYLDYWRLYVPNDAELIGSNVQPVSADLLLNQEGWSGHVESLTGEEQTQVFAGLFMLPLSKSIQFDVSYSLPGGIIQSLGTDLDEYSLLVKVQPGLSGLPFWLVITLPDDTSIMDLGEGWKLTEKNTWAWQGILDRSIVLRLSFYHR